MPFYLEKKDLKIKYCCKNCVLKKYANRKSEFSLEFAGASKTFTRGIRIDKSFIVQKEAESWDGNHHDLGITIDREDIVKNDTVLNKIRGIEHDNLLKIKAICQCSVELEYIDGYILNTRKGPWILGEHSYEKDYLDVCSPTQFLSLTKKILSVIALLHKNEICHTDVMDHNIMVDKTSDVPILIDLIGAMPYSKQLEWLDNRVFLEHVVIDGCNRLNIPVPEKINSLKARNGDYSLDTLNDSLKELEKKLQREEQR